VILLFCYCSDPYSYTSFGSDSCCAAAPLIFADFTIMGLLGGSGGDSITEFQFLVDNGVKAYWAGEEVTGRLTLALTKAEKTKGAPPPYSHLKCGMRSSSGPSFDTNYYFSKES